MAVSVASCSGESTPGPGGGTTLDPEVVPDQDPDPYPGESADLQFAVSDVIGDNMVVQQNKELRLWGQGKSGEEVKITVSWSSKTFTNKVNGRGEWRIRINVPPAPKGNPEQTVTIEYGRDRRTLKGILIGEVWVCSGQSNMQMPIGTDEVGFLGIEHYRDVIAASGDYPTLRMYTSTRHTADTPQWNCRGTGWQISSSLTSAGFSAVAYFFGKTLIDRLNVPVGLIVNAYGGAPAQMFTPREALESDPELKARYIDQQAVAPGVLWNAMVYPFLNCSIRGMIWYQGEGNWQDTDIYHTLIRSMVYEWRKGFAQGDFPHYYVQIAAWFAGEGREHRITFWDMYSYIRETQARVRGQVANSEMVVTLDTGDPDDIHPAKKREVGERLAWVALNRDYGLGEIRYLGPRYRSHTVDGGTVTVTFDHADGLRTNNGAAPKHFYIAGEDKKFYLAEAVIKEGKVVLTNASVPQPAAVRYAFVSAPVTNLENAHRLPAEPFRTDNWPSVTYNVADMALEKPY